MKVLKNKNVVFSALMILFCSCFVSCQKKTSTKKKAVCLEGQCEELKTFSQLKIIFPGSLLPEKIRVEIDGVVKVDECQSKLDSHVVRFSSSPEIIFLEKSFYQNQVLDLKIYDLGSSCEDLFLFYENHHQELTSVQNKFLVITL